MNLNCIFVTQRRLRNPSQLPGLVRAIHDGTSLPPVLLAELEDGLVFIQDGHHRCVAFVLAGREKLHWGEFILLPVDFPRSLRGKLVDKEVIHRLLACGAENAKT